MRNKYLLIGIVGILAATGWSIGHTVWRVKHQLVTLNVRNMPLAEVLRKIEGQTRQKIRAETPLDAKITLTLANTPLSEALDRIGEQAGARWSTIYAVYSSGDALGKLDSALRGDGKLETVGFTKIAPGLPTFAGNPDGGPVIVSGLGGPSSPDAPSAKLPPGRVMAATEDVEIRRPGAGPSTPATAQGRPRMVKIVRKGGEGGTTETEIWTPEELVIQSDLNGRLGETKTEVASPAEAESVARKVNGRWTTYVALRKTKLGMDFGGFQHSAPRTKVITSGAPGGQEVAPDLSLGSGGFEEAIARQKNDEFGRLTPEQRVARARERKQIKGN